MHQAAMCNHSQMPSVLLIMSPSLNGITCCLDGVPNSSSRAAMLWLFKWLGCSHALGLVEV